MSLKFEYMGIECLRVDGIWFEYINYSYILSDQSIKLEQLYKGK
jgi:hypothetical protein